MKKFLVAILLLNSTILFAGSFYTNVIVIGPDRASLIQYLKENEYSAFLSKTIADTTVIYEKEMDTQNEGYADAFCAKISKHFSSIAIYSLNHDSDILLIKGFKMGFPNFIYNSSPDYFEGGSQPPSIGNLSVFLNAIDKSDTIRNITAILSDTSGKYITADHRHMDFVTILDLPEEAAIYGFQILYNEMKSGNKKISENYTRINIKQ